MELLWMDNIQGNKDRQASIFLFFSDLIEGAREISLVNLIFSTLYLNILFYRYNQDNVSASTTVF